VPAPERGRLSELLCADRVPAAEDVRLVGIRAANPAALDAAELAAWRAGAAGAGAGAGTGTGEVEGEGAAAAT
jgi:hypothetical protein